ncbi:MAG TPA: hypothetical protein PLU87_09875 [Sedimentisphaerales bacterium]|nr:hypothetical protein [Sedimentisphaerales bacterium]HRS11462.1 hypothetical protein [Sedimentisphaerales bacterium]HRV48000.1 hypothetical protein [Sedimentisphaerales bacterium]
MTHEKRFIPGGYILYPRQFLALLEGTPLLDRAIWTWLNCRANHRATGTRGRMRPGQLVTTLDDIVGAMRWHHGYVVKQPGRHMIRRALARLAGRRLIVTRRTTRGLVITICDYETYQNPACYERPSCDTACAATSALGAAPDRQEWKKKEKKGTGHPFASTRSVHNAPPTFAEMNRRQAARALAEAQKEFLTDDEA